MSKYRDIKPNFGFDGLGEFVFYRTYSKIKEDGTNEAWWETVQRVVEGIYSIQKQHVTDYNLGWNPQKAQYSAQEMYDRIFTFKMIGSGRALWSLGSTTVMEKGLIESLFNCSYRSTGDGNLWDIIANLMDWLMLGVGIGTDLKFYELKKIVKQPKEKITIYKIPDSREGWVEATRLLVHSFYGGNNYRFDYSLIRDAGKPIRGFGGISSGHKPLKEMHEKMVVVLSSKIGENLEKIDIADIVNFIGVCVVAGNIRRSAQLIGSELDDDFLNLKNYEINPKRASHGWASNNSVIAEIGMDYSEIANRIKDNAEPGVLWLENGRAYSRMRENEKDWKDKRVGLTNPCFSAETRLLTKDGYVEIGKLDGKSVEIVDANGNVQFGKVFSTGYKKTILLKLNNDKTIRCTPDHIFQDSNGKRIRANSTKNNSLKSFSGDTVIVESIQFDNRVEKVYDFSLPKLHWGIVEGVVAHNCGEIYLESGEMCNLSSINPSNHSDIDDYKKTIKYAFLFAKTITLLSGNWVESNRVMLRNRRIGLDFGGIAMFAEKEGLLKTKEWMETGYDLAKYYDEVYSNWFAVPQSIKLTATKPNGTTSLLAGVTPGVHYPEANYYIRRVRLANASPFVKILKKAGYKVEKTHEDPEKTLVVEFPVKLRDEMRTIDDVSMWEQLKLTEFTQKNWADNAVSSTITFTQDEAKSLEHLLEHAQFTTKGLSFLPKLEGGAYPQMPYESITKDEYTKMAKKITPLDFSKMDAVEAIGEKYCETDKCELKTEEESIKKEFKL